ncbi:MAG TPA: hypothetical protein VF199_09665 [Bacillales bacterium]
MVGFLLFISFILHAAALYWIFQLKRRMQGDREVEGLMSVYLDEMREENDKLIRHLQQLEEKGTVTENKSISTPLDLPVEHSPENTAPQEFHSPPTGSNEKEDHVDSSVEAQALFMAEQGMSYGEIAKKLGRGKGEIELFIRLAGKKDNR